MDFDPTSSPSDAALILAAKRVFGTEFNTEELREIAAYLRNQSFFSAQTTDEHLLDLYQEKLGGILHPVPGAGEATTPFNAAYVRTAIKDFLQEEGYQPQPNERGTITDLSSTARINLVIKTNVEMAQGQGGWLANQRQPILDQWPGQELFRAEARVKIRDWLNRWRRAGAQTGDPMGKGWTITSDGKMIALVNHPIWSWIGSSALFRDALDQPWPPFAFNSGMWVRRVSRDVMVKIGLFQLGQRIQPMTLAQALKPKEVAA